MTSLLGLSAVRSKAARLTEDEVLDLSCRASNASARQVRIGFAALYDQLAIEFPDADTAAVIDRLRATTLLIRDQDCNGDGTVNAADY